MGDFINVEIPTEQSELYDQIVAEIQATWPEWEDNPANLETRMFSAFARIAADMAVFASTVSKAVFMEFGRTMVGIPPQPETYAMVNSTWEMKDDAGYTIATGTRVTISKSGDEQFAFEVVEDVVISPGTDTTLTGGVTLRSVLPGEEANGLGPSSDVALLDAYTYIGDTGSITLDGTTSGGADAETEDEYADRLVEELRLLTPRPIVPEDFAVLARRNPAVARSFAVDGWDGVDTNNERTVGLVLLDESGEDVNAGVKTEVEEDLEALREVNFVVYVGSPTYTPIFVTTTVRAYRDWNPADVDAGVVAAIENYLSPANWAVQLDEVTWEPQSVVRYGEVWSMIDRVPGVNYIESLYVDDATAPDSSDVVDITLSGTVPLTRPADTGTGISVTANPGP